jgi:predicted nucleic acid-binding protein
MKDRPIRCIIDASVGIKLFVDEPLSGAAHYLFMHLALPGSKFYIPDLFYIECTNVLWKYVRRGKLLPDQAASAVDRLCQLALHNVSTMSLAPAALTLANQYDLSAYDAAYAALAQRVNETLITADEPFVHKLSGTQLKVQWLGNLQQGRSITL